MDSVRERIQLDEIPHFTTTQKFCQRIKPFIFDRLLHRHMKMFRDWVERIPWTAIDSSGFTSSYANYNYSWGTVRRENDSWKPRSPWILLFRLSLEWGSPNIRSMMSLRLKNSLSSVIECGNRISMLSIRDRIGKKSMNYSGYSAFTHPHPCSNQEKKMYLGILTKKTCSFVLSRRISSTKYGWNCILHPKTEIQRIAQIQ